MNICRYRCLSVVVISARAVMSRRICTRTYVCPAEVVCGYFGDWFYRVGNGTRVRLLYARPSTYSSSSSSSSSFSSSSLSFSSITDCTYA
ncbi:hypothetical protein PUN28_003850 [Cardiocondyla obscurior]|uniref:Secreted protein n=1 Tax=Cardiocondyla obscurior TaxID=286306 RepID=A0AAW2GNV9_9HYME